MSCEPGRLMSHHDKSKHRKPAPLVEVHKRAVCPVCGEPSYSASGVHPQCACRQHPNFTKKKG
jgi:hypothetical protein